MSAGSPGLIIPSHQNALGLAAEVILERLKAELSLLSPDGEVIAMNRLNILKVLEIISNTLGPALVTKIDETDGGVDLVLDHPGIVFLNKLADLFRDLNHGKSPKIFKPNSYAAPASNTVAERKEIEFLIEFVGVIQARHQLSSHAEATRVAAGLLKKLGWKHKGKPITAEFLRRLKYRRPKYRRC